MSYHEIIKDSFRYTLSDLFAIIILGIILCSSAYLNKIFHEGSLIVSIFLILLIIFLTLMELGYSFKIIEETINGSTKPPIFHNYKELLIHGIKDSFVYFFYFFIIGMILGIGPVIDKLFNIPFYIATILSLLISSVFFIFLLGSLLNLAHHKGKLVYAFKFSQIWTLLKNIGLIRLIILYFLAIFIESLILGGLFDIGFLGSNDILSFIANFFITPFMVLFSERVFGLSGRQ